MLYACPRNPDCRQGRQVGPSTSVSEYGLPRSPDCAVAEAHCDKLSGTSGRLRPITATRERERTQGATYLWIWSDELRCTIGRTLTYTTYIRIGQRERTRRAARDTDREKEKESKTEFGEGTSRTKYFNIRERDKDRKYCLRLPDLALGMEPMVSYITWRRRSYKCG